MNAWKRILSLLLIISVFLCNDTIISMAQSRTTKKDVKEENLKSGDFEYSVNNGQATIKKYSGESVEVSVPANIEGYPVVSIGKRAFENGKMTSVFLPEGIVEIESFAFSRCRELSSISLPEGLTSIGGSAFISCNNLTTISFPASLKKIGYDCFMWSGLTDVKITKGLTSAYAAFTNSALSSVSFEEGITEIPSGMFKEANYLTQVTIPNGVTTINGSAFDSCDNLTSVSLPESLRKIESLAFKWCKNLKTIYWPDQLTVVSDSAFQGISDDLNVFVTENTPGMYKAIDLGFLCNTIENSMLKKDGVLISEECSYILSKNRVKQGEYNTFILNYSCKKGKFTEIKDPSVKIYIPQSMNINDSIIYLGEKQLSTKEYTYNKKTKMLSIPVSAAKEEIKLYLKASGSGKIISYATLSYSKDQSEPIGTLSMMVPSLSLDCSDQISDDELSVSGVASPSSQINIYVDGTLATTISTDKNGDYGTTVSVSGMGKHKIKAELVGQENIIATKNVSRVESAPKVTKFIFYYQVGSKWNERDLLHVDSSARKIVVIHSSKMRFTIEIENEELIRTNRVFIVSKKEGDKKYLHAKKESNGKYIAEGYFDPKNHSYIPGSISVSYQLDDGTFDFEKAHANIDVTPEKQREQFRRLQKVVAGSKSDDSENKITVTNSSHKKSPDNMSDIYMSTVLIEEQSYDSTVNLYQSEKTVDLSSLIKQGYRFGTDQYGHKIYYTARINSATNQVEIDHYSIHNGENNEGLVATTFSSIKQNIVDSKTGGRVSLANYIKSFVDNSIETLSVELLNKQIDRDPNLSTAQKNQLKNENRAEAFEDWSILAISVSLGVGLSMVGGPITGIIIGIFLDLIGNLVDENDIIAGTFLDFIVDPSGYVYEAVDENRLKDVTATIYYKKSLQDTTPVLWDAAPYGQANPLLTDEDGKYAWDVPEGYWQVKFEKEGYETAYSDWLPVPPEQTDINIGMISSDAPAIEYLNVYSEFADVCFSQYMNPETIRNIKIKDNDGKEFSYTLKNNESQKNKDGKTLATTYKLVFNKKIKDNKVSVVIPNTLISYNGKSVPAETRKLQVKQTPSIKMNDRISIKYNTQTDINIEMKNCDPNSNLIVSSSSDVALNASAGKPDNNGNVVVKLFGVIPGEFKLLVRIDGTSCERQAIVKVIDENSPSDTETPSTSDDKLKPVLFKNLNKTLSFKKLKKKKQRFSIIKKSGGGRSPKKSVKKLLPFRKMGL